MYELIWTCVRMWKTLTCTWDPNKWMGVNWKGFGGVATLKFPTDNGVAGMVRRPLQAWLSVRFIHLGIERQTSLWMPILPQTRIMRNSSNFLSLMPPRIIQIQLPFLNECLQRRKVKAVPFFKKFLHVYSVASPVQGEEKHICGKLKRVKWTSTGTVFVWK